MKAPFVLGVVAWLLGLLPLAAQTGPEQSDAGPVVVAVMEFENASGQNLPGIGRVAHDVISSYLVGLPSVEIVTRDKLDSVLKEKELAASGLVGDSAKSTELAGLTGADFMVSGAVLQYSVTQRRFNNFGVNTLTLFHRMQVSLQVIDLRSARMSFSKTYDLELRDTQGAQAYSHSYALAGRDRDLLNELVKLGSDDLQRAVLAQATPPGSTAVKVSVASDPPGADIELNGVYIGSTPAEVSMDEGVQSLKLSLQGFRVWEKKVKVSADLRVAVTLAPLPPEEKLIIEQTRSK